MDIYDARKPLQSAVLTGRIYLTVKQETGELSLYLDTGYEVRLSADEVKKLYEDWTPTGLIEE